MKVELEQPNVSTKVLKDLPVGTVFSHGCPASQGVFLRTEYGIVNLQKNTYCGIRDSGTVNFYKEYPNARVILE